MDDAPAGTRADHQLDLLVATAVPLLLLVWVGLGNPRTLAVAIPLALSLLFLPGYVLTVALFPRAERGVDENRIGGRPGGDIDLLERFGLSVGLSVTLLPVVGVILGASPWGISRLTAIAAVTAVTVIGTIVGLAQRARLPGETRFRPHIPASRGEGASILVSVTLAASVVIALGVLGFTVALPQDAGGSTDLYLMTLDEEGDPVAAGYPETVGVGETIGVEVGVENDERGPVEYVLLVQLEELEDGEEGEIIESDVLAEERFTLSDGESWQERVDVTPTMPGEDLRVSFLLYQDDPHFFVDQRTAYRHTHIWLDVPED